MSIATTRSDLSKILLVASDQTYAPNVINGVTLLAPFADSSTPGTPDRYPNSMPEAWGNLDLNQWVVLKRYDDPTTGLGGTLYGKANADGSRDYLVAMQGTRGLNIQDWGGNLIYGWDKWISTQPEGGQELLGDLLGLADVNKIHFTGQSLGGALAQYAAYEYFDRRVNAAPETREAVRASMTLTTFNGLGAVEGLATGLAVQGRTFAPELLAGVDTAHFWIPNDLVSRLGGGNLNGSDSEYVLGFRKANELGVPLLRATDNSPIALDVVSAHRIEAGFYRGFNLAAALPSNGFPLDFTRAQPQPISRLNIGGLARAGTYFAWLTNQDGALSSDWEAWARAIAAVNVAMGFGNQEELRALVTAVADGLYAANQTNEFGRNFIVKNTPKFLQALALSPSGLAGDMAAQSLALVVEAGGQSDRVEVDTGFGERLVQLTSGAGLVEASPAFDVEQAANRTKSVLANANGLSKAGVLFAGTASLAVATSLLGLSAAGAAVWTAIGNILEVGTDDVPAISRHILREVSQALKETYGEASEAFSKGLADAARALVGTAVDISRGASALAVDAGEFLSSVRTSVADGLEFVARSLANSYDDLTLKFTDAFDWGASVARETLDSVIKFLSHEAEADTGSAGPSFEEALDALKSAAQTVVIAAGRPPNPFGAPDFDPEAYELPSVEIREGDLVNFTVFLPHPTGALGQRVKLQLAGAAVERLSVLSGVGEMEADADGTFTLNVSAGMREVSFGILADADIDSDEALSLSATLVNPADEGTHLHSQEAAIALDGEPESAPSGGREIRGDWAPKEYTDPSTGQSYYAYDDLGNIEREPGKPNEQNFREPDASLSGSTGADHIVTADSADVVYAFGGDDAISAGDRYGNIVYAGAGSDWVEAGRYDEQAGNYYEFERLGRTIKHGEDQIYGGAGNDQLYGHHESSVDALYDASTAPTDRPGDWISGGTGADWVYGGAGDDVLMGGLGQDLVVAGAGMDVLLGDDQFGVAVPGNFWTVVHPTFGTGEPGFGNFEFGLFPVYNYYPNLQFPALVDPNNGDPYVSYYKDGGGPDVLNGGAGSDILIGQLGDDTLYGGQDADILAGWEGADQMFGGSGDDLMAGDFGRHEEPSQRLLTLAELVMPGLVGAPGFDASVVDQTGNDLLEGGGGNDIIYGEGGGDVVLGGDGNDTLYGDADYLPLELHGNDLLDGGAGDDALFGGGGGDKLYGGDGNDVVHGGPYDDLLEGGGGDDLLDGGEGEDQLRGGSGADVLTGGAERDALGGGAGDDRLDGGDGDDGLRGDAGADQLQGGMGNDLLSGGMGDDILGGGEGDDTLDGGAGSDILRGGAGNDTYLVGFGFGNDVIDDAEGESRLHFGSGILAEDLDATLDATTLTATLTFGAAGDVLSFDAGQTDVDGVEFFNGLSWSKSEFITFMPALVSQGSAGDDMLVANAKLRNDLRGGAGDDRIEGASHADLLAGGDGDDVLDGKSGSDRYFFAADESGIDIVAESGRSTQDEDVVEFGAGVALGDLELVVTRDGEIAEQAWGGGGTLSVRWDGGGFDVAVDDSDSGEGIESFRFADGSSFALEEVLQQAKVVLTRHGTAFDDQLDSIDGFSSALYGEAGDDLLSGGAEDDFLYGGEGDDLLHGHDGDDAIDGGVGSDYLYGGQGDDTYLFGRGSGMDGVSEDEDDEGSGFDTVVLEADVAPEDVSVERDFGDLVLLLDGGDDVLGIFSWFREATGAVEQIRFADGTVWDAAALEAMLSPADEATEEGDGLLGMTADDVLSGLGGDDEIYGFAGGDLLEGSAGYDYLEGGKGDDTYIVSLGTGTDQIYEDDGYDRILFGSGIASAGLRLSDDGYSLFLDFGQGGDSVTVSDWLYDPRKRIEEFRFADGAAWNESEIWDRLLGGGNRAPALESPIADQSTSEDTAFSFTVGEDAFSDPDGDELVYTASLADGSGLPAWLSFDAGTRTLSGTPLQAAVGMLEVCITATDGSGLSAVGGFDLTVVNANDAPIVDIPIADKSFDAGSPFVFAVPPGTFADEDPGDTLTLAASLFGGGVLPAWLSFDAGTGVFAGDAAERDNGIFQLQVTASDSSGASAGSDFALILRAVADSSVTGGRGDDAIYGGGGDETLAGKGGNDYLFGDVGDDMLKGGSGNDALQGGDGNDTLRGGSGQNLLDGGAGDDVIFGGGGSGLIAGGAGNDIIRTGSGTDVILFNRGDGVDTLIADREGDNTLSFGGGIRYSDLALSKEGKDLVVSTGGDDRVVLRNWYSGKHSVRNLQIIVDASDEFDSESADLLYNRRVQTFDFLGLVSTFDAARAASPGVDSWALTNALLQFHLSGADDMALGGDLAYWYGRRRTFAGISLAAAQQSLGASGFGADAQELRTFSGLQEGFVKLA